MQIDRVNPQDLIIKSYSNSGYLEAKARFDDILINKLGIKPNSNIEATISKMQEPRNINMLDSINGFDTEGNFDVRSSSADSVDKINQYLKDTPMQGMGEVFKHAENRFGINAYFLASLAVHESGFGRSAIARDKKNLFGFGAYDSNPYGHAHSYHSFAEGVIKVSDYLNRNYLTKGGSYYNGSLTKDIGKNYATDSKWADKVNAIIKDMMK